MSNIATLRKNLVGEGFLDPVFEGGLSARIGKRVKERLAHLGDVIGEDYFEPRGIERHFADVTRLLDRVLAQRREAQDLDLAAVRAAADIALFEASSKLEEEQEKLRLRSNQVAEEAKTQEEAARAFDGGDLAPGMRRLAEGAATNARKTSADLVREEKLITDRWALRREYQQQYRDRHNEPGNAHNFKERLDRVERLVAEDLAMAFERAKALAVGFEAVFDEQPGALPDPGAEDFIDAFLFWVRELGFSYEVLTERESDAMIVIPLCQPVSPLASPLVDGKAFKDALAATADGKTRFKLSVDIKRGLFADQLRVRIMGVGISYGSLLNVLQSGADVNATRQSYVSLRGRLTPPLQENGGKTREAPTIEFGDIGVYNHAAPRAYCADDSVLNLDPVGEWKIEIEPLAVFKDNSRVDMATNLGEADRIVDLKLHLRVRALR